MLNSGMLFGIGIEFGIGMLAHPDRKTAIDISRTAINIM